jgi:murein DD-endopeptidase MepM/ murein hydrolase activator NlpD
LIGNPTTGPRIVPFGQPRLSGDFLPNGHPGFRVTQRYGDLDAFFRDRIHGAMDIANFFCGDVLLAPLNGLAQRLQDPNGALGIRVTSGLVVVEYWHLSRYVSADGASVSKGQTVVGNVGSTGLDIGGCHVHIKSSTDGGRSWRDPWPLLDQNIAVRVKLNATNGVNIRRGPGQPGEEMRKLYASAVNGRIIRTEDGKDLRAATGSFPARHPITGATHGLGSTPNRWTPIYVRGAYRAIATPLVTYI